MPTPGGVPVMFPAVAVSNNPVGNVPTETDQVYGCVPPCATSAELYANPTSARLAGHTPTIRPAATFIVYACVTLTLVLSVTVIVKLKVPVSVGVPLVTPGVLHATPSGRLPTLTFPASRP